jgi:hypothetical protein
MFIKAFILSFLIQRVSTQCIAYCATCSSGSNTTCSTCPTGLTPAALTCKIDNVTYSIAYESDNGDLALSLGSCGTYMSVPGIFQSGT